MYNIIFTNQAKKDIDSLDNKQKIKLKKILENLVKVNPFEGKKLIGDLSGYYSIRLNIKDRIVYKINKGDKLVTVMMCKTHYRE